MVDGARRRTEEVAAAEDGRGTAGAGWRAGEGGGAGAVDVVVHAAGWLCFESREVVLGNMEGDERRGYKRREEEGVPRW